MQPNKQSLPVNVLAGAIGGLTASFAMNQFQGLWSKLAGEKQKSCGGDDATVKTADAVSRSVLHQKLPAGDKKWAGPAVHYAFGTLIGALYGALATKAPGTTAGLGTAWGTAVWIGADEIGVPAAGLSGPPAETPVSGHIKALASHLVYGLTTDLTMRGVRSVIR